MCSRTLVDSKTVRGQRDPDSLLPNKSSRPRAFPWGPRALPVLPAGLDPPKCFPGFGPRPSGAYLTRSLHQYLQERTLCCLFLIEAFEIEQLNATAPSQAESREVWATLSRLSFKL